MSGVRDRIRAELTEPETRRRYVQRLFGSIAGRYDITNDVMSLGMHRRWKRRVLDIAALEPGHMVLDLAAGTGDLALAARRLVQPGGRVVATDLTPEMLEVGVSREAEANGAPVTGWVAGDAAALPYPDQSFDRTLIGYGLRNFAELDVCLAEVFRCLKPGGRIVALDFGHPARAPLQRAYLAYLGLSTRAIGWALHRNPEAYLYIPESLERFPGQQGVRERMEAVGYVACGYRDLLFGAMAINFGERPSAAG